jgi:succinate dehydrogenase/fumarate reductase flavoprotein subunit
MAKEINAGRTTEWGGLKLDLSGNLDVPDMLVFKQRMDDRYQKVRTAQGEAAYQWKEPWDVTPSVHYMMGGVKIDRSGRSNLEGLYAVGESAGGTMGANRLGSASICDVFVTGMAAGKEAARHAKESAETSVDQELVEPKIKKIEELFGRTGKFRPIKLKRKLQKLMLDNVGISRDEDSLSTAINEIDLMQRRQKTDLSVSPIRRYNSELIDSLELNNMLTCAKMIATCARIRTESRGGHLRLDYPEKDDANWLKNITVRKENGQLKTALHPLNAPELCEQKEKE